MLGHSLCGVGLAYLFFFPVLVVDRVSLVPRALCCSYRQVAFCGSTIAFGIGDYQSGDMLAIVFLNDSDVLQQVKHWLPAVI
jgi:hypothetical protein